MLVVQVMVAAALVMPEEETAEMAGPPTTLLTVTLTGVDTVELPAASRATAVRVWLPLTLRVVFQETPNGPTVASAPRLPPSSLNWTPATPTLSEALADTARALPETVAPAPGALME